VAWCAAGEANLPWYLAERFPYDDREQVKEWTEVLRYIRATDPFRRPLTIHPTAINRFTARHATENAALLDFDMLQTPHGQREIVPVAVRAVRESYAAQPMMPVVDGEACYEKLLDTIPTQWPRAMFWLCVTNGVAGHTYGANGIWQANRRGQPHGPSPHHQGGNGYGVIPWDEAMHLPGSKQMGYGKRLVESLPWTKFTPLLDAADWADASADADPLTAPQACGMRAELQLVYAVDPRPILLRRLPPRTPYQVEMFDPITGERTAPSPSRTNDRGELRIEAPTHGHDWAAIVELAK
jgi:hypothetical protein